MHRGRKTSKPDDGTAYVALLKATGDVAEKGERVAGRSEAAARSDD
jgi:hypothetical protein